MMRTTRCDGKSEWRSNEKYDWNQDSRFHSTSVVKLIFIKISVVYKMSAHELVAATRTRKNIKNIISQCLEHASDPSFSATRATAVARLFHGVDGARSR